MSDTDPPHGKSFGNHPVENVSWDDCQKFLQKLNARDPQSGITWSLPTEAQWEYACRAGTTGSYGGTGRLDEMGWYTSNSGDITHPVAVKQPNAWGLYDMHGNVWEWCQDFSGGRRVAHGGSYNGTPTFCRSASRIRRHPGGNDKSIGFRLLAFGYF